MNKTEPVAFGEIVTLRLSNGEIKNGQVLDTSDDLVIVQVFEGRPKSTETPVSPSWVMCSNPVSTDLVGRILDGAGRPRDGGPEIVAEEGRHHWCGHQPDRQSPHDFIQTVFRPLTAYDVVRGPTPDFLCIGSSTNDIAQIARQAKLKDSDEEFIVVFCAMGITAGA